VALVTRDLKWGIGTHVRQLADQLTRKGLDVEVFLGNNSLTTNFIPRELEGFDVINVHGSCFGAFRNQHIPTVLTVHSLLKTELKYHKSVRYMIGKWFENRTLKHCNKIVVVNDFMVDELSNLYGIDKDKITIIPNAVSVEEFDRYKRNETKNPYIISCGRKTKRKRFDILKKACKSVKVDLKIFHGELSREELIKQYKHATLFVASSEYETFGYSVAEAMAAKCPVICSNIPAFKSLAIPGKTALTFRVNDSHSLAIAISYLLRKKQFRASLAENAYRHVKQNFSWSHVISNIIKVYKEATS